VKYLAFISVVIFSLCASALSIRAIYVLNDLDRSIENSEKMLDATLYQIGDAAHVLADAGREQKRYWKTSAQESAMLLHDADKTLTSFNDSQKKITVEMDATLQSIQRASDSTNTLITSPAISQTLNNVQDTSHNLDLTSLHVASTSANVDKEVERLTRPKSFPKQILMGSLNIASKLRIIF